MKNLKRDTVPHPIHPLVGVLAGIVMYLACLGSVVFMFVRLGLL
jgi:hypothetical protein